MPRTQRTKSAAHEALQRRAYERPGGSFSGKLAVWYPRFPTKGLSLSARRFLRVARPAAACGFWCWNERLSSPPPPLPA